MGSLARPNWTEVEIIKLKELCDSGLYRFDKLAQMLDRPTRGVMYKCYEQGFSNDYRPRLYTYNTAFFRNISPDTCYWAAILTTDGCVSIRNGYTSILWRIAVKDESHMIAFKKAGSITHPIKYGKQKCSLSITNPDKVNQFCLLRISGATEWADDLKLHFGVTTNKTLRCPPPNLVILNHKLCYIRGFIDGDGCVSSMRGKDGGIIISVTGVNREMIAWIKQVVDNMDLPKAKEGPVSMIHQQRDKNCYVYSIRGLKAAILFDLLRRLPTPNLARKWDNPRILAIVDYWKARKDIWPPETFFANLLKDSTNQPESLNPTPNPVYIQDTPIPAV